MLRWNKCNCRAPLLSRVERHFWMRAIPSSRLYNCGKCGDEILTTTGATQKTPNDLPVWRKAVRSVVIVVLVLVVTTVGLTIADREGKFSLLLSIEK